MLGHFACYIVLYRNCTHLLPELHAVSEESARSYGGNGTLYQKLITLSTLSVAPALSVT